MRINILLISRGAPVTESFKSKKSFQAPYEHLSLGACIEPVRPLDEAVVPSVPRALQISYKVSRNDNVCTSRSRLQYSMLAKVVRVMFRELTAVVTEPRAPCHEQTEHCSSYDGRARSGTRLGTSR